MNYVTKTTPELLQGELVGCHGMVCLIDRPLAPTNHPGGNTFWTAALVINREEVSNECVPYSFTAPREVWSAERRQWVRPVGEHRWAIQGNEHARWGVLLHGPHREGLAYFS